MASDTGSAPVADPPAGASLAERARIERFISLSDADLGAIAYDADVPASTIERRAAAGMLAARNRERRAHMRRMSDVDLARIVLDRRHLDRSAAIETLAERIVRRAEQEED